MDLKLTGKTALVTGTGSQVGFGKGIAVKLAEEGCDVILYWLQPQDNAADIVSRTG